MKIILVALGLLLGANLTGSGEFSEKSDTESKVEVLNFDELEPMLCPERAGEETIVVNFFATWCQPCVREMPYFLELYEEYREEGLRFIIVSLDFPQHLESRLLPFIEENNIEAEVYLLDDTRQNYWIPKVSEDWSGSIPATIVCNGEVRKFYEREFHNTGELKEVVDPVLFN